MSTLNLENIKHPDSASNNISVDSSGRTGVGTATPSATLHVEGGSNTQMRVSSTGAEANLTLDGGSYSQINNTTGALYVTNNNAEDIYFRTASTTRMTVDGAGRVTMPYQPSVKATINTNGPLSGVTNQTTGTTIIPFNNVGAVSGGIVNGHNTGGHFDTNNHRFTCPIDGKYLVIQSVNVQGDNIQRVRVNGSDAFAGEFRSNPNGAWEHNEISAVLTLNANDYIEAWSLTNGDFKYNGGGGGRIWDTLSIHFLG